MKLDIAWQMKKRNRFIKLLLGSGADLNTKNRVTGMPMVHATSRSGNFELLEILLKKKEINISLKDYKDRTILHWKVQVSERKPSDKYILDNCFKLLLDSHSLTKMVIDIRDVSDNTALYVALQSGIRDRAKLLLSEVADVSILVNACPLMLPTNLSLLEEILEDCLLPNDQLLMSKDLLLRFNNELLKNIFPHIAESQQLRKLLKHPVSSNFLFLKWLKARFIFFLDMIFYAIFLFFLTVYDLCSEQYNTHEGGTARNTTGPFSFNDNNITSDKNNGNVISQPNDRGLFFLWMSLKNLLSFLILRKLLQLSLQGWVHVESLENWLEISLIIATFIPCSGVVESADLRLHFSAVVLLLGWSELFTLSGRLPLLSVRHQMLRTVSVTFLRYMVGYVTLLITFAFSFYILFKGSSE